MNDEHHLPNRELRNKNLRDDGREDDDLRRRFAVLRRDDEQGIPEFARLWRGKAHAPRSKRGWVVAAAFALVLVALGWRLTQRLPPARPKPADVSVVLITEWKAPTDFLLATPGRELLSTVPQIGAWRGYTATTPDARHLDGRKKFLQ
jgi:hypothetical protein